MEPRDKTDRTGRETSWARVPEDTAELICSPKDGAILEANAVARRLLSLSTAQLGTVTIFDLVSSKQLESRLKPRGGSGLSAKRVKILAVLNQGKLKAQPVQVELQPQRSGSSRGFRLVIRRSPESHTKEAPGNVPEQEHRAPIQRKEEELRHSLAFSEGILNSLRANIAVIDRAGTIVATNAAWRTFCRENDGGTGDHIGESYFRVCRRAIVAGEKSAQEALRGLKSVIKGASEEFELVYPCNSPDKERWFRMAATRLADSSGCVVVSHTDVTEQKLALAEAVRRQHELELIAETVPASLAYLDSSGTFRFVNHNCAQVLGMSPERLIGMTIEEVLSETNLGLVKPHLHEAYSGQAIRFDFDGRLAHDRRHNLIVDLVPDRTSEGDVKGLYVLAFDVSELRLSQRELEQKKIALEEVIKSVERERERAVRELAERIENQLQPLISSLESKRPPNSAQLRESLTRLLAKISGTSAGLDFGALRSRLSPREIEICELIRSGRSSKEIAELLHVSVLTVNKHRQRIRGKLHLESSGVNLTSFLTQDR